MSHGLLPGLVLAALAGAPLVLGAAGGALVAAGAISLAARDRRIGADLGVAVAVSTLLGLGALLALSPEAPPRLEELLFGDLLGIDRADLLARGAGRRRRRGARLRPPIARAERLRPRHRAVARRGPARWGTALLVLLGAGTVAAAPGLGSLLLVALIVAPAAAALRLTRRLAPRSRSPPASRPLPVWAASRCRTTPTWPPGRASPCVLRLRQFSRDCAQAPRGR